MLQPKLSQLSYVEMLPQLRQDATVTSTTPTTMTTPGQTPRTQAHQHHQSPLRQPQSLLQQSSTTAGSSSASAAARMDWDSAFLEASNTYGRDNAVALRYVAQAAAHSAQTAQQAQLAMPLGAAGIPSTSATNATSGALPAPPAFYPSAPSATWHQELLSRIGSIPPQPNPGRSRPAQYKAYVAWSQSVAIWHTELEAFCRQAGGGPASSPTAPSSRLHNSPHLATSRPSPSTQAPGGASTHRPQLPPSFALAAGQLSQAAGLAPVAGHPFLPMLSPVALEAYLVNEVTPNYRRFRALADIADGGTLLSPDASDLLVQLEGALEAVVHSRVLTHIAPEGSPDIASASFVQFAAHELMPSWERFRASVGGSPDELRRLSWGDDIILGLVASLEALREASVSCGCH